LEDCGAACATGGGARAGEAVGVLLDPSRLLLVSQPAKPMVARHVATTHSARVDVFIFAAVPMVVTMTSP
ncbi:MAG: hypothetical protein ABL904_27280, partial [Hyphomicrobiaceae bacterium]